MSEYGSLFAEYTNNVVRSIPMAYVITEACTSCGTCESECPVSAISQGDTQYVIDADACTSCGLCASVCPSDAIEED